MTAPEILQILNGGGVLALAVLVLLELRSWRTELRSFMGEVLRELYRADLTAPGAPPRRHPRGSSHVGNPLP